MRLYSILTHCIFSTVQSVDKEGKKGKLLLLLENTVVAQWGSVLMQNVTYHQGETL